MAIPGYQKLMLPLLKFSSDKMEHSSKETVDNLARILNLSDAEKQETYTSGKKVSRFYDRVHWAISYLKGAGMLESTKRGHFRITNRGLKTLEDKPAELDNRYLRQFPEFLEYIGKARDETEEGPVSVTDEEEAPDEQLEESHRRIESALAQDILAEVKKCPPRFFEDLVVELLVAMDMVAQ